MAESPSPSFLAQFLQQLLGALSPRSAYAEVIKADEGTRTLTGEDVERFRALIGRMIQEAMRQGPQDQTPSERKPGDVSSTSASVPQTPEDGVDWSQRRDEDVPEDFRREGYSANDMRQVQDGDRFVGYLLREGFMKPEQLERFQGETIDMITSRSSALRNLHDVYQQEHDRERMRRE